MFPSIFKDANVAVDCGRGWRARLLNLSLFLKKNNIPCKITHIRECYAIFEIWFEGEDDFSEQVIHLAKLVSAHICSVCGKPGTMNGIRWYVATRVPTFLSQLNLNTTPLLAAGEVSQLLTDAAFGKRIMVRSSIQSEARSITASCP